MQSVEIRLKSWAVRRNPDGVFGVETHMRNLGITALIEGMPIGFLKASLLKTRDVFNDIGVDGVLSIFGEDGGNPEFTEVFELIYGCSPNEAEEISQISPPFSGTVTGGLNSPIDSIACPFFNLIFVESIEVEPDYRRFGYGGTLLRKLAQYANVADFVILKAHPFIRDYAHLTENSVLKAVQRARAFYARNGFHPISDSMYMVATTKALKKKPALVMS
jgi:GNAT superfamily N-acetyltransferase